MFCVGSSYKAPDVPYRNYREPTNIRVVVIEGTARHGGEDVDPKI